jgi:tetratricopeptide (TPR) repeat protein/tRNA A-37 threonylcarbamoyl transferase component Bud32
MSTANADRNLLFGILALQMDFVSRDGLIRGMNAWVLEKSKPLGQVLVEQGALPADAQTALDVLVKKHLELHGNDPEKSLAAVSSAVSVREDLKQVTDPDVQASLVHVPTEKSSDPFLTRCPTVGTASSAGTRFRILRPHAKGGLGEVFVANDQELDREVALKQIQDRHADRTDSRARFVVEAKITGGLEHPGVVPVYGLGEYPDGRPFYAMRFIRGTSLRDAIDRFHQEDPSQRDAEVMELRDLLGRFIAVCYAMAYAHSRGVVHRDLKPSNIMLGKYGETLVVDWGLAKAAGCADETEVEEAPFQASVSATAETVAGSAVGTPQFMSPEQAAGRLDLLSASSDIYSLGATLYVLLTGKLAFTDTEVAKVLQKVQRGEFPRPCQVRRDVPPALEAICLKAMALKPQDRYVSAKAMAADVERWLADGPVSVYQEPLVARLARWGRRHRTFVASAGALLITAVVALTISTVLISREQARTLKQQQQADKNFKTALGAVNEMLTEVGQEQLANEPGMEKKRRALLARARAYYQQFLDEEEHSSDPKLRKETAQANRRLADISRLLGENASAKEAYDKAIDLLSRLLADAPGDASYRQELAASYSMLGEVLRGQGRVDEAAASYQKALTLGRQLLTDFPSQPEYRRELARTNYNLGILDRETQKPADAVAAFGEAITALKQLSAEHPNVPEYHQDLARAYLNLGPALRATGQPKEAEEDYHRAVDILTELIKKDPLTPAYRQELAVTYNNLGFLLEKAKRYPEAEAAHKQALDLLDKLSVQFPSVPVYRKELANTRNNLAIIMARSKNWQAAEEDWRQALAIFEKLHAEDADVPDYLVGKGLAQGNLGWLFLQRKDPDKARQYLEAGSACIKEAMKINPKNPAYRAALRDQYTYLAEAYTQLGKEDKAAAIKKLLVELEAKPPAKAP